MSDDRRPWNTGVCSYSGKRRQPGWLRGLQLDENFEKDSNYCWNVQGESSGSNSKRCGKELFHGDAWKQNLVALSHLAAGG